MVITMEMMTTSVWRWTVHPSDIVSPFLCTRIRSRRRTSLSRFQVQVSFNGARVSGKSGEEAKSRISGDFAGLSSLKEQLISQSQPSSASQGFTGLLALKEELVSQKRASPTPIVLNTKSGSSVRKNSPEKRRGSSYSVSLMVSNLPKELTREEFEAFMERIPEISGCTYLNHKRGLCRGYGFCDVRPGADVAAVMEFLSQQTLGGRALTVSFATGKKDLDQDSEGEEGKSKSVRENLKPGNSSSLVEEKSRAASSGSDSRPKRSRKDFKAALKLKNEARAEPTSTGSDGDNLKPTLKLKNEARAKPISTVSDGDSSGKNPKDSFSERLDESGLRSLELQQPEEAMTVSSDREGRLSGESVLAALERFASRGRARQQRVRGTSARSTLSDSEDSDEETSSEQELIEFKLEWAERIQSLEASLEQLKRL